MNQFKNLSDEDVLRIERGIVYSFPARDGTGLIVCVGTYGDLSNQVRVKGKTTMAEFLPMATDRLTYWFCHRINGILEGEEISEYASWKIVDGMPVAPPYITPLASGGYVVDELAKAQFYKAQGARTVDEDFQHFLSYTGYSSLSDEEKARLRVAYVHGAGVEDIHSSAPEKAGE